MRDTLSKSVAYSDTTPEYMREGIQKSATDMVAIEIMDRYLKKGGKYIVEVSTSETTNSSDSIVRYLCYCSVEKPREETIDIYSTQITVKKKNFWARLKEGLRYIFKGE